MRKPQRHLRLAAIGAILGATSTFGGYGAGGLLILSILVGCLTILIRTPGHATSATAIYAFAVCSSFYTFGFRIISGPLSTSTLLIFVAMIGVPISSAVVVDWIYARLKAPK